MKDISFTIPLAPYTKKNSQKIVKNGKRRFIVPSDQFLAYQESCLWYLKPLKIDYPVNVETRFFMPTRRRVDLPNLIEAIHDILVKGEVLVDDNCKIIVSTDRSRVFYDKENPRTEIIISPTEPTFIT